MTLTVGIDPGLSGAVAVLSADGVVEGLADLPIFRDGKLWMRCPAMGAQRRVEARIGQLLGPCEDRGRTDLTVPSAELFKRTDRHRFRTLARGLEHGLAAEDWRSPRESLSGWRHEFQPLQR